MVLAHVRDVAVDRIGWCLNRAFGGDRNSCHAGFSITAGETPSVHMGISGRTHLLDMEVIVRRQARGTSELERHSRSRSSLRAFPRDQSSFPG